MASAEVDACFPYTDEISVASKYRNLFEIMKKGSYIDIMFVYIYIKICIFY